MIKQCGAKIVWGVPKEIKPVVHTIPGKMRLRFRNRDAAKAYFRTPEGIRCFVLEDCGEYWRPVFEQGRNSRP